MGNIIVIISICQTMPFSSLAYLSFLTLFNVFLLLSYYSHYRHYYLLLPLLLFLIVIMILRSVLLQLCRVFNPQDWEALYPKIHTIVSISFLFLIPMILCVIFYLSLSCVVCGKKQRESRALEDDNTPLRSGARSSRSGTLTKSSHTKEVRLE